MAGGYWRLAGNVDNSRDCYFNAIAKVPERFKDVVLTNLAQLIYSSGGSVDNALLLVQSAHKIDDKVYTPRKIQYLMSKQVLLRGTFH